LAAIKNVGEAASRSVVVARERISGFQDFKQFCNETDNRLVSKGVTESLIKAGALDSLGQNRAHTMALLERRRSHSRQLPSLPEGEVAEWSQADRLAREKEVLGVYLSGHPLDEYRSQLSAITHRATSSLEELHDNTLVTMIGMVNDLTVRRSRRGNAWGNGTLEDLHGRIDLIVFADSLEPFQELMKTGAVAVVKGRVRREVGARPKVLVAGIEALRRDGNYVSPRVIGSTNLKEENQDDQ
jgi:DNA polymerase-3 subunit alpha